MLEEEATEDIQRLAGRSHWSGLTSTPVMSTLVDATGLFIYFTIAGIILRL